MEPKSNDVPSRIEVIPKYMGWRLNPKTPPVTKTEDFSNGLTVVPRFLKSPSALRFRTIPNNSGSKPIKLNGKNIS